MLEGNFVNLIYELLSLMEDQWENLVNDIESGTITNAVAIKLPPQPLVKLGAMLAPDKERASYLRREFQKGFKGTF